MPTDLLLFDGNDDDVGLSGDPSNRRLYPDQFVHDALVQIGQEGRHPQRHLQPKVKQLLADNPYFLGNREFWKKAFRPKNPDIEWLVRGYVMVGAQMNWPTPSTDPLIPLFRKLRVRMPRGKFDELVSWVVRHTHHRLVPFGRETRAKSWTQYSQELNIKAARAKRAEESRRLLREQRSLERIEKAQRHSARRDDAIARGQQRARVIDWLSQLSAIERLKWLAIQDRLPIGALPPSLFLSDAHTCSNLSRTHRNALLEKLGATSGRHLGWHRLYVSLIQSENAAAGFRRDVSRDY